jgi:RimJ/RimL family protein N-acetyltransferase
MILELNKSTLRPFRAEDKKTLALHANDRRIADFLMDTFPHPYTEEDAAYFITNIASSTINIILTIEIDGEAAGCISIHPQTDVYRQNAELGYWLGTKHQRKGIMTEAINAMVNYTFTHLDIDRIYAKVFENNIASARILEKCNFVLDATLHQSIVKNDTTMGELIFVRMKKDIL